MADAKSKNQVGESSEAEDVTVRFCPICGTQMYQGNRYGFLCWICPDCDFDEPVS